jgi:hypothetical protein
MAHQHEFIFDPGKWVGEGTVGFSASSEQMFFATHWEVESKIDEGIRCEQEVKMEGADDKVHNKFHLYDVTSNSFNISLENDIVGQVIGTGIIDEQTIAWEFRGHIGFQGYEVYEKLPEGDYRFHAEYASPDQFRTIIDGIIRKVPS